MPIIDRYVLKPSNPMNVDGRDEETANLALTPAIIADVGVVQGQVLTAEGTPIPFATVQLFDSAGNPVEHVNTNPQGRFVIPNVPLGAYFITASEPGFLTPSRIGVSVVRGQPANVIITMQRDPNATRGAIYGIVRDSNDNAPIADAMVELYQVTGSTQTLVGSVFSNSVGQYMFANLDSGTYFVRVSLLGYLSSDSAEVTISGRQFAPLDIIITVDPDANTGTVSGIITDQTTGAAIPNAIVALYLINGGVETIVDITTSTQGGLYLFGDVPSGTYRVKATVQDVI